MKHFFSLFLVFLLALQACCYAAEYDLPNMTSAELNELKKQINDELALDHDPSSDQCSAVRDSITKYVEDYYGADNVSWAWFDYSYTREWDFFTMSTHADIRKQDGGKAEYKVYGEVIVDNGTYVTVFTEIGTEVIFDERSARISDARVLAMLGLNSENANSAPSEDALPAQTSADQTSAEAATDTVIAQKGDKNDTVKNLQQMLIRLGYLSGNADGDFGGKTEAAVAQFQSDNGLETTGKVTQAVYNAIEEQYRSMPEPVEYPSYTAKELYSMYDENELNADATVKGKLIKVTGKIDSIESDWLGRPIVYLRADSYGFELIGCNFSKDATDTLAALKKDSTVTILGECSGMSVLIIGMDDCAID